MIPHVQLVIPRRNRTAMLEPVDQPLSLVPFPVSGAVEVRIASLISLGRDPRADPPPSQVTPDGATAIALIPTQAVRAQTRSTPPGTLDRALLHQCRQGNLLMTLPGRQDEDDRLARALEPDVDLRAVAALTASQRLWPRPFLAPAACWWARTTVPSTKRNVQSTWPCASAV